MSYELVQLVEAEKKAAELFNEIEIRGLIRPGQSEKEINKSIYDLAFEMFKIKKYWHKRIVRSGPNTLYPYDENPKNLIVEKDDIVFLDFGPIFEEWEADYGRTYVLGNDSFKKKLANDIEIAWKKANLNEIEKRLTGWQLESFKESYDYKVKNGMSLFKKNLIKEK